MNRVQAELAELGRQFGGQKTESFGEAVIGFAVVMGLLALVFWQLEKRWPEDRENVREPGSRRTDLAYWAMHSLLDRSVFGIGALLVLVVIVALRIPRLDTLIGAQPIGLQFLEGLVVADFTAYWIHRAQHQVPRLWRLHAVHHSSTRVDWLAGARSHPLEGAIARTLLIAPLFLAGFQPVVYALLGPVLGLYGVLLHANVDWDWGRWRWWLVSPRYHRWHHSAEPEAVDRNFAVIVPRMDRLFGTAYFPEDRRPRTFGLVGERMPVGWWAQLRYPFRSGSTPVA
jgi:sterol desaturase/sphingolipid hydroxylase (fatty acid hydroxylase superfamily)